MNVLVIPEDFRKDQFLLEPLIRKMLESVPRKAKIQVCRDPLLGGVSEALKWERIKEVLDMHRYYVQLFLLIVDRDGELSRRKTLEKLEQFAEAELPADKRLLAENAWEEVEVWAIAGQDLKKGWRWNAIRAERDVKERYFDELARARGLLEEPGQGRFTLGREAAANYKRVRSRCPEDIGRLEKRINEWLNSGA